MSDVQANPDDVEITVNGKTIFARKGELVIAAAARHDIYIPHFCYHPRMDPVGMCRQCLVEIDSGRGPALNPSCMVTVAPGMKVDTESPTTKRAQEAMLEFLLINHPLDCPVCDKGGECPLQDQTLAYGPGESRFVEEKRHYEKPISLSELVQIDRERCVLCDRCTRFSRDVAGDALIHFTERGNQTQVLTFPDQPFASYFSGNTVQICPVGALLATPYRFKARPWDLQWQESTCTACSVGCRITVESSRNRLVRFQGVDVDPVNWGWLCDRGRFGYDADVIEGRLRSPLLRKGGELAEVGWSEALREAAAAIQGALDAGGPGSVAVLGGARGTNEDAYAWAKLAKSVIGTDNVDAQLGDGLDPTVVLGLPQATIDDACGATTVLLLGPDLKEELPVLYLRLRDALVRKRTQLVELGPVATGLTHLARASLRCRPGEIGALARAVLGDEAANGAGHDADELAKVRDLLGAGSLVVILGRASLAESDRFTLDAAAAIAQAFPEARFLPVLRRGNVRGALELGLAPGLLPGRAGLDDGRDHLAASWAGVPAAPGLDATGILTAAAEGRIGCLVLLGADPLSDFPDRALAERALSGAARVVAVDTTTSNESLRHADVVLAAAGFAEKPGTTTNIEGRVSVLAQQVTPPGTARADWMIAAELAMRLGGDLGFTSLAEIQREIGAVAPAFAGFGPHLMGTAELHDGVVVPVPRRRLHDVDLDPEGTGDQAAQAVAGDQLADRTDEPAGEDHPAGRQPDGAELAASRDAVEQPYDEATATETAAGSAAEAADAEAASADAAASGPSSGSPRPLLQARLPVEPAPLVPVDRYSLRLVTSRKLYDAAVSVSRSAHLRVLAPGASLHLSPHDLDQLGVDDGASVRVTSARAAVVLPVRRDPAVPRGSAWVPFNQPDEPANALIDAGQPVTDVRVETL